MYSTIVFAILCIVSTSLVAALPGAPLQNRHQKKSKSKDLYARADVVNKASGIKALFEFTGYTDGRGTFVKVQVDSGLWSNTTEMYGPFMYHVHTNPIGTDGNCDEVRINSIVLPGLILIYGSTARLLASLILLE